MRLRAIETALRAVELPLLALKPDLRLGGGDAGVGQRLGRGRVGVLQIGLRVLQPDVRAGLGGDVRRLRIAQPVLALRIAFEVRVFPVERIRERSSHACHQWSPYTEEL